MDRFVYIVAKDGKYVGKHRFSYGPEPRRNLTDFASADLFNRKSAAAQVAKRMDGVVVTATLSEPQ